MSKQIYICEFCGKLQLMHFGQCKYCDTHEDGTRYKHYQKEEVKRFSKQDMIEHIDSINNSIDGNIGNDKMDKKYVDDKINELKRQLDAILDNIQNSVGKDLETIELNFKQELKNIKSDYEIKNSINVEELERMHKSMEHTCDNEINSKIIDDKLKEIKELKDKYALLNENLQLKIREKQELEKELEKRKNAYVDYDEFAVMKLDIQRYEKLNRQGQERFQEVVKENSELKNVIDDLKKIISKLKKDNKDLNDKSISVVEKPKLWSDEEDEIALKLYNQFIKNKNKKGIDKKISDKLIEMGYDRNPSAVQRRLYRLGIKKKE